VTADEPCTCRILHPGTDREERIRDRGCPVHGDESPQWPGGPRRGDSTPETAVRSARTPPAGGPDCIPTPRPTPDDAVQRIPVSRRDGSSPSEPAAVVEALCVYERVPAQADQQWSADAVARMREAVAAYYTAMTAGTASPVGRLRAVWLLNATGERVQMVAMTHYRHEVTRAIEAAEQACLSGRAVDYVVDPVGLDSAPSVDGLLAALGEHVKDCRFAHGVRRQIGEAS
jgi:hypothetical protein